jgi:endonuclease/exonuclease/phosphatase family metal-dependent hydrolase
MLRVLTWNLFHGRAVPPAGRDLLPEFGAALAGWDWDVALLQEVPPWWPPVLGARCGAHARTALTSRNVLLPLRRWIARRAPDLIKSSGGGANAILVRGPVPEDHRRVVLRRWPERRVAHGVRLGDLHVVNLHGQAHADARAEADLARAAAAWADAPRLVLGGDLNLRRPHLDGFEVLAGHSVDHVLGRGVHAAGPAQVLDSRGLSDHAPLLVPVDRDGGADTEPPRP